MDVIKIKVGFREEGEFSKREKEAEFILKINPLRT